MAKKTTKKATKKTTKKSPRKAGSAAAGSTAKRSSRTVTATKAKRSKTAAKTARTPGPNTLAEGARAPDFTLPRDGGMQVSLDDFAGRKLVVYFYPRADTPGCTRESIDFSRLKGEFAAAGTDVIGISADPPKAQEAFRDKYKLAVPLVSDEAKSTIAAFGAWGEKSMYGRVFAGILRTTVLIGPDGRIARIWRNVKVDGHADDVLAAARTL